MSEYPEFTPRTDQVREAFAYDPEAEYRDPIGYPAMLNENRRVFDRWLAAHDAEVRASVVTEDRWQYGAQNPDDPEGKIVAWSRGFTKFLVEHQGHLLFRRRPGSAAGPWEAIPDA